jgi:hypothetical protein
MSDQTGDTANTPSNFTIVDLYGGPLDGRPQQILNVFLQQTVQLRIATDLNQMQIDQLTSVMPGLIISPNTQIMHVYTRKSLSSLRFYFDHSFLI